LRAEDTEDTLRTSILRTSILRTTLRTELAHAVHSFHQVLKSAHLVHRGACVHAAAAAAPRLVHELDTSWRSLPFIILPPFSLKIHNPGGEVRNYH